MEIKFNDRQIEIMIELFKNGMSATKIGTLFGCTHQTISKRLKANNVSVPKTTAIPYTDRQIQIIMELSNRGMSAIKISQLFGTSPNPIRRIAKENGYVYTQNNQKYHYIDNYFEVIDTEEKAYWLGFIFADGSIRGTDKWGLEISLKIGDMEHLRKFEKVISTNGVMLSTKDIKLNGKTYKACKLSVANKKIAQDLIKHNCIPNKSYGCEFPTTVPNSLLRHFIRGYFDGDGSIYFSNTSKKVCINIVGDGGFLNTMFNIICEHTNLTRTSIYSKQTGVAKFIMKQGSQAEEFLKWIYEDSSIYLDRKMNLYKELV